MSCVRQSVLIHGGTGGVGTLGIQIATFLEARVLTTVGSDEALPFPPSSARPRPGTAASSTCRTRCGGPAAPTSSSS